MPDARDGDRRIEDREYTFPDGMPDETRRRLLAAGGGGGLAALAGCLGLFTDETENAQPDRDDYLDYTELETMQVDWIPDELVVPLETQIAHDDEEIRFRFQFDSPEPYGWYHDMLIYDDGEWRELDAPNPGVADPDYGATEWHEGFTEDRISFLLGDGSVQGFAEYGGWLTAMLGVRSLPGAVEGEAVEEHPHLGEELGQDDVRKFIPQSREGEWWEHDWDAVRPEEELDEMLTAGEFLDLPIWRGHRSNPVGYATNHHVLEHRHGAVSGEDTYESQEWDAADGPEYMFDPDVVDDGALEIEDVEDGEIDPQNDVYWLEDEHVVEFDPEVAEFEGAVIPRRILREPTEGEAVWEGDGEWSDGTWTVEMGRALETGYDGDISLEPGEVYEWSPAVHWGSEERWHHVAYPYLLGLETEPDPPEDRDGDPVEEATLVAEEFEGDPDWDEIETHTIPCMYPGQVDWTWLTSGEHPYQGDIREAEVSIWEFHDYVLEDPERFAQRNVDLELDGAPRE